MNWLPVLSVAAAACAFVHDEESARKMYRQLLPSARAVRATTPDA